MKTLFEIQKYIYIFFIATLLFITHPGWSMQSSNTQKNYSGYQKKEILNIEGTIEIRAALYLNKNHGESLQYLLHAKDGQSYYLNFVDKAPTDLITGSMVNLKKALFITDKDIPELLVSANDIIIIKKALQLPDAFGPQKTVVLLVNFQDQPNNQPFTKAAVQGIVFDSVNRQYIESSYNQTNLVGDVYGWMTIPINSTTECNTLTGNIPLLAATAAAQQGIDLSSYIHRIYMFPTTSSCGWSGLGSLGRDGAYSNAWINGYNDMSLIVHELGHNVGLYHSNSISCPNGGTQGSCSIEEYGDHADTMGWGFGPHFNAYQKERLGWLNYGTSPLIQTITTSGNYIIHPYETQDSNSYIKGLKILRENLSNGSQDYYYVEYRTITGFDASLGSCGSDCNFTKGVLLHQGNTQNPNSSNIFFPNSNTSNLNIIALLPGQSFNDPNAANGGVTITLNSVTGWSANVKIQFGNNANCSRKPPTLTISPSTLQSAIAGGSKIYSVNIINEDSATCNPSLFSIITSKSSSNMIINPSGNSLTIASGNKASLNVNVNTALNTPNGIYLFAILAVNTTSNYYGGITGGFKI